MRRITIEDDLNVTIVRFNDRTLIDEKMIQEAGEELAALVNHDGRRRLVLDFTNVRYMSSAMHGKLIFLSKVVKAADGTMALCGIRPEVFEVFKITKLNKFYRIFAEQEEALLWVSEHGGFGCNAKPVRELLELRCPVDQCDGVVEYSGSTAVEWRAELSCPGCGSRFTVRGSPARQASSPVARVAEIALPTYEGEFIRVVAQGEGLDVPTRAPYTIEVRGRLDLFASQVIARAWQTVPAPRRVLVDLRKTSDVSDAGAAALYELCARNAEEDRVAVLIGDGGPEVSECIGEFAYVSDDEAQAIAALGEPPVDAPPFLLTVHARTNA